VAVAIEVIKAKAVKANKAKKVTIKAGANIEVKDIVIKVKKEVTITLIIDNYY
jgi:hypothetical protein